MTDRDPGSGADRRPDRSDQEARRLAVRAHHLQRGEPATASRNFDWQTQDLFAWGARQKRFQESGSISVRRSLPPPQAPRGARSSRRQDGRLGDYLYSGSFGRLTPARRDAGIQRNRILFSVLLICLTLYVIVHLVGR
jgi:hypothetical protein